MNAFQRFTSMIGLAILLVVAIVGATHVQGNTEWIALSYLVANVTLTVALVFDSRRGGISLLVQFFLLWFIAVPALVQVASGVYPWGGDYSGAQIGRTFALLAASQLAYALGQAVVKGNGPQVEGAAVGPSIRLLRNSAIAFVLIGALLAFLVGPDTVFRARFDSPLQLQDDENMREQFLLIARSLTLLALVLLLQVLRSDRERRRKGGLWAQLIATAVIAVAVNYPPALARFELLGAVLMIIATTVNLFSVSMKSIFSVLAPIFMLFLFPAIKFIGAGEATGPGRAFTEDVKSYLTSVDFDGFKQTVDTFSYLTNHDYRWGSNFIGVLLYWVPRSMWAAKPVTTGSLVSSAAGYPYTNVSSLLPAEGLVAFGWIGAIAVMVSLGILCARVERSALIRRTSSNAVMYVLMVGYVAIILRGSLNGVAPMFMTSFFGYGLVALVARRGKRVEADSRPCYRTTISPKRPTVTNR